MSTFVFGGGTPKKILYNGVEVKKLLYNGVEVWRKEIEAGKKTITMESGDSNKELIFTVPDGVTKLKLTTTRGNSMSFTVTPGETVNFRFSILYIGPQGDFLIQYSLNGSDPVVIGQGRTTITIAWSEEINNS